MARSRRSAPTTPKTRSASIVVAEMTTASNNLFELIDSEKNEVLWTELLRICEAEWYAKPGCTENPSLRLLGDEANIHADAGFRLGMAIGRSSG